MKELFGWGSLEYLAEKIAPYKGQTAFVVHGRSSYEQTGAKPLIEQLHLKIIHFSDFQANPRLGDIESAIEVYKRNSCTLIIGVGGGTAMDIAKSVSLLIPLDGLPADYIQKRRPLKPRSIPLILVPTTSGTGSEATHFAVVYIDKKKYSLAHQSLLPDVAIIDPSLTSSLPPYITACTGMDALCQAIEAYWSIHATEESKEYSRQAIPLIMENIALAVHDNTRDSRIALAKASNLAGKAINIAFTTAAHALSYPMTSYFNVPHGLACALSLPQLFAFNAQAETSSALNELRGLDYVRQTMQELVEILGCHDASEASSRLRSLMHDCDLPTSLTAVGIKSERDLRVIIDNGFDPERVANNPRVLTKDDVGAILQGNS